MPPFVQPSADARTECIEHHRLIRSPLTALETGPSISEAIRATHSGELALCVCDKCRAFLGSRVSPKGTPYLYHLPIDPTGGSQESELHWRLKDLLKRFGRGQWIVVPDVFRDDGTLLYRATPRQILRAEPEFTIRKLDIRVDVLLSVDVGGREGLIALENVCHHPIDAIKQQKIDGSGLRVLAAFFHPSLQTLNDEDLLRYILLHAPREWAHHPHWRKGLSTGI